MFIKLLIRALKKRFKKSSPDEQNAVRELASEAKSDTRESLKAKKRRTKKMADEKVEEIKKEEIENKKVEEEKPADEKKEVAVEEKEEKSVKEQPEVAENEATEKEEKTVEPTVEEVEPIGNGVRVEDLVTKDLLTERLAAFEAKLDAVLNENKALKDKLSEKDTELNGMRDKYENKDFGNVAKQGMVKPDRAANSTFDEYSRQFM